MFIDQEIARRIERTDARTNSEAALGLARLRPDLEAASLEIAGGYASYCGGDNPMTQACGLGMQGEVTAAEIDHLEDFFRSRGSAVRIIVSPLADESLLTLLRARDYRLVEFENVSVLPLAADHLTNIPAVGMEIGQVGEADHTEWVRVVVHGFAEGAEPAQIFWDIFPSIFQQRGASCWLARINGESAGGAGMAIYDGIAAIFGAATLLPFRRRGVQTALLRARLRQAAQAGCELAIVGTKPGTVSQRNMERQGFRLAYTKAVLLREWLRT